MKREELVDRARALGWSQNELARRIKRNVGHFSRVLSGERPSAVMWIEAEKVLGREERRRSNGAARKSA